MLHVLLGNRSIFVDGICCSRAEFAPRRKRRLEIAVVRCVVFKIGDATEARMVPISLKTRRQLGLAAAEPNGWMLADVRVAHISRIPH
jgi:hypothetical protein